jgi:L-lactate utilization protein LutC
VHASPPHRLNPFTNRQPLKTGGKTPFMERVHKALGRQGQTPSEPPPAPDGSGRQVPPTATREELLTRFLDRAKANTMIVQKVAGDPNSVTAALNTCLANHTVSRTILNAHELEQSLQLPNYLQGKNIGIVPWGSPNCRNEAFTCEASITDCRCAIADSGSLVVWSDAGFGRSSTLVVPVHIILLPASRIMPDMIDALQFAQDQARTTGTRGHLPSNVVIINGPSKTADIEMNLVTGVHGPKYLYVVVLENL